MSVQAVHRHQPVAQAEALSKVQAAKKHESQDSAVPRDKVSISVEAKAKQTAAAIGAESKSKG
jgi:hypothetical protein